MTAEKPKRRGRKAKAENAPEKAAEDPQAPTQTEIALAAARKIHGAKVRLAWWAVAHRRYATIQ